MSIVQATAIVDSDSVADDAPAANVDALAPVLSEGAVGVEFAQPMLHSATAAVITNSPVRLISISPGCVLANDVRQLFARRAANFTLHGA
jgi:hypothetical protein